MVDCIERWLTNHDVDTTTFDDVYEACVYLLTRFEQVPQLAIVGADWLAPGEFSIIRYIRETWPRVGVLVYGGGSDAPGFDFAPMILTCRTPAALDTLVENGPTNVLHRITGEATAIAARPRVEPDAPPAGNQVSDLPELRPPARDTQAAPPQHRDEDDDDAPAPKSPDRSRAAPPRAILSAEELSALLNGSNED